jgi:hypothetical protein
MNRNPTTSHRSQDHHTTQSVRRAFDGSIDFGYYRRQARQLRSDQAWSLLRIMGELLPFHRTARSEGLRTVID